MTGWMPNAPSQGGPVRKLVTTFLSSASILALSCLAPAVSQAAPCDGVGAEQAFLDWHDQASYVLVSGGDFESAAAGWTLSDGAAVVPEGNPLRPASSANSLGLAPGAAATTPAICVGKGDPVARLFLRTTSSGRSGKVGLKVEVLYLNSGGEVRKVKKAGWLHGTDDWAPSRRFGLAQGQFTHGGKPASPPGQGQDGDHGQSDEPHGQGGPKPGGTGSIELRFTAAPGSGWQIDDVFVDPRARY
jgi:hypothetical protein